MKRTPPQSPAVDPPIPSLISGSGPNPSTSKQLITGDTQQNVVHRQKRPRPLSTDGDNLCSIKDEILTSIKDLLAAQTIRLDQMENRMETIFNQTTCIQSSNKDIEKAMSSLSEDIRTIESRLENLCTERNKLDQQITHIVNRIDNIEINDLKTCIELRNVPKVPKEKKNDLYSYVFKLCERLKLEIALPDIRDVYRMPSKKENTSSSVSIELTNTLKKAQFNDAVKAYNKSHTSDHLNSTHLGLTSSKQPIYISDLLTPKMKRLLFLTRDFAKTNNYAYAWTSNGRIYLRKAEGHLHVMVKSEAHLREITASPTQAHEK